MYCVEAGVEEEPNDPHTMVSSSLLVNYLFARVVFDAATTHFFNDPITAKRLAYELDEMDV